MALEPRRLRAARAGRPRLGHGPDPADLGRVNDLAYGLPHRAGHGAGLSAPERATTRYQARSTARPPASWRRWTTVDDGLGSTSSPPIPTARPGPRDPADDRGPGRGARPRLRDLVAPGLADGPADLPALGYRTTSRSTCTSAAACGEMTRYSDAEIEAAVEALADPGASGGGGPGHPRRARSCRGSSPRRWRPAAGSPSRTRPSSHKALALDDPERGRAIRTLLAEEAGWG